MQHTVSTHKSSDDILRSRMAIKLKEIRIQPTEERKDQERFVFNLITRQMDVIHSLHELEPEFAIDLRYLFDPDYPYVITIYFLLQLEGSVQTELESRILQINNYLVNLLQINHPLHDFETVKDKEMLEYLIKPFEVNYIQEVIRREDLIALDSLKKTSETKLGFAPSEQHTKTSDNNIVDETKIYYVYPFTFHTDSMERLCNVLFMQQFPCLVSICLRPYSLTSKDKHFFEERIMSCEKYAQMDINPGSFSTEEEIKKIRPFLKMQAGEFYNKCTQEFIQLQDTCFLLKIQIASTNFIQPEIPTIVGSSFTEHTGHPSRDLEEKSKFAGGYEYYTPDGEEEFNLAANNLHNLRIEPWIPTWANPNLQHCRYLFDVSEACSAFRLPLPVASEFPGINTSQFQAKTAPSDLPQQGLHLGEHAHLNQTRQVYQKSIDRKRHTYLIGQTGTGKSTLLKHMILQDINAGQGIGLVDPHGELVDDILSSIPEERKNDVVYVNPGDPEFQVGINLLEYSTLFEKDFCVNYLIEVFDHLYDLRSTGGPVFEMYMRNALMLLLEQPSDFNPTVLDVPYLFQDKQFRRELLSRCDNIYVKQFWENEAEKVAGEGQLENIAPYITSKLSRFVYNDTIRAILGQRQSSLKFRDVLDSKKILLVDLRKGLLGETNSYFLGMMVVGKILTAALSRTEIEDNTTLPEFYLYVDEFQNLATNSFVSILSEARKYNLSLILANQYISH